jgi:hypothetical protein
MGGVYLEGCWGRNTQLGVEGGGRRPRGKIQGGTSGAAWPLIKYISRIGYILYNVPDNLYDRGKKM